VHVYERQGTGWTRTALLQPEAQPAHFGSSLGLDDDRIIASSRSAFGTAAFVFRLSGDGTWIEEAALTGSASERFDFFGDSVDIQGDLAVVGASRLDGVESASGGAFVYRRVPGERWVEEARLLPPDVDRPVDFGVASAIDEGRIVVRMCGDFITPGAAYVYVPDAGAWVLQRKLVGTNGVRLDGPALAVDGGLALVSREGSPGFVSVFDLDALDGGCGDACVIDCNANGLPDLCEIADGTTPDCNANGIPDECELDCNGDGIPDECEIADGTDVDCNGNLLPDACEPDCNGNGIADECDIADGYDVDCDGNGVPDKCQPDCNGNEIADECDIADGTDDDCNGNGIPDSCDLADGTAEDCNRNDVPDSCELSIYQLDDGTVENGLGGIEIDYLWLNQFDVVADATTIRFVSIAWGPVAPGEPALVVVYGDPDDDGNPGDAVLLAQVPTVTPDAGDDVFTVVPTPPIDIGMPGESFFVGVVMTIFPDWYPAAFDESSPNRLRSWDLPKPAGTIDLDDLSDVGQPYTANYMIRADAVMPTDVPPDCVPRGDVDRDGVVGAEDLLLVLRGQGACGAWCPGDVNGDDRVDGADLVEVLRGWSGVPAPKRGR
jgi:hypothetical protein